MDIRYRPRCGSEVDGDRYVCDKCGYNFSILKMGVEVRDPILAGILSFLFPGLGHIYIGDIGRGLIVIIIAFIIAMIALSTNILVYLVYHILQIYDAYREAKRYNNLLHEGIEPW